MHGYKRNQGLEAISVVVGEGRAPGGLLRTDVKRLLDTDRSMKVIPRSNDPDFANYAFFSGKAPGRGFEVSFSAYEIFALLVGLHLMAHGWPQATAVSILRRARPALERKHAEILRWNPHELFDAQKIREAAKPGALGVQSTRPVFLMTLSSKRGGTAQRSEEPMEVSVLEQNELKLSSRPPGTSFTLMELTRIAHDLHNALAMTKPSKRGRGSS
jgi:hypothetical protein